MESRLIIKKGEYTEELPPEHFEFKYQLDDFQLWGCNAIEKLNNLLALCHTGSGKTTFCYYAIAKWLQESNSQIIYTGPVKSLINQKFKDFNNCFDSVGILTGDIKINPTADVLVMTTEILRNSLLRKNDEELYEFNFNPNRVKCVIFDEVHYINDTERGKIWEETITQLNSNVHLIMLSGTLSGGNKLAQWIVDLKQRNCTIVSTIKRPVPLLHYLYHNNKLHCIKDENKWKDGIWTDIIKNYNKRNFNISQLFNCIKYCIKKDMLPVNVFLLSRKQVQDISLKIPFNLLNHKERTQVNNIWNKYLLKYKHIYDQTSQWEFLYNLVIKGIAIHHAGLIPILKEMMEILYELKLIKVMISTSTLSIGVNIAIKTIIFTSLTMFDGKEHNLLSSEIYNQMAGRAGRRGLDTFGTVIMLPPSNVYEYEAKRMINSPPLKITSKLSIDYTYILKRIILLIDEQVIIENSDDVINYLIEQIDDTMMVRENREYVKGLKEELRNVDKKYNFSDDLNDYKNRWKSYIKLKEELELNDRTLIKMDPKDERKKIKKLKELKKKIPKSKFDELDKWYKLTLYRGKLLRDIDNEDKVIKQQLNIMMSYLLKLNIVNDNYLLTPIGRIIGEVNECNCLVLGSILKNGYLNVLDFNGIISLLSIFIADYSREEEYVNDLEVNDELKDIINEVIDIRDEYADEEDLINRSLPFVLKSEWHTGLSMVDIMNMWVNDGIRWSDVRDMYGNYEGDFCKNVLRLVNLIRNIVSIAKLTNNIELLNKLDGCEEKLIKDIVSVDSLYL